MSDSKLQVLKGRIDYLEGAQDRGLISWARFHLGDQVVLLHGYFVYVPKLQEGDEVEVVGLWAKDRFEGQICRKVGQSAADERLMKQARMRREYLWVMVSILAALAVLVPLLYWPPSFLWTLLALFYGFTWAYCLWGRLALIRKAEEKLSYESQEVLLGG